MVEFQQKVARLQRAVSGASEAANALRPRLVAIAGPCVIENAESSLLHAERLATIARATGVPIVFKSSFDKANRTSHGSFRGPGLDAGLRVLAGMLHANDQDFDSTE